MEVGHLIYSLTRLQIPKIGQQQGLAKKNQGPALKELRPLFIAASGLIIPNQLDNWITGS